MTRPQALRQLRLWLEDEERFLHYTDQAEALKVAAVYSLALQKQYVVANVRMKGSNRIVFVVQPVVAEK